MPIAPRMAGPALASIDDDRAVRAVKVYEEGPYIDAGGRSPSRTAAAGPSGSSW